MMHKKFDIEQAFIKNGFKKKIEKDSTILVSINNQKFAFPYVTNEILSVAKYGILFAIAEKNEEIVFFINRDFDPNYSDYTSPYRTYYQGLMKNPFYLCFPFDGEIIIHTEKDEIIKICMEK